MYTLPGAAELASVEHREYIVRYSWEYWPCIVQHYEFLWTWKRIVEHMIVASSFFSRIYMLKLGNLLQQRNTQFLFGISWCCEVQVHIYYKAISVAVSWMRKPYNFPSFLYGSYKRLDNSPDLLFCALWILSLRCFVWQSHHVIKEE